MMTKIGDAIREITTVSPFEAYKAGKEDTVKALVSGLPLNCSLKTDDQRELKLMREWRKGVSHALKQAEATLPTVNMEAKRILDAATR